MGLNLRTTRRSLAAIGLALLLPIACTNETPGDENGEAPEEPTKVTVGYIPVGVYAYFWQAIKEGYFEDENLDVELTIAEAGSVMIPAMEADEMQFGVADVATLINARDSGVGVRFVSLNIYTSEESPIHAVITNDPAIKDAEDLEGKKVACSNAKFNANWLMMRTWLRQEGADPERVQCQEVPFPDMMGTLESGSVVAAAVVEPSYTIAEDQGMRVLGTYFTDVKPHVAVAGVFATDEFLSENEAVAEGFVNAINRAIDDLNADEEYVRRLLLNNTDISPELAQDVRLGIWQQEASLADIDFYIDLAREEGLIEGEIAPEDLLWEGAPREEG